MDVRERVGVVLVNLGSPDAPDAASVRRFLREFLSDPRVVDYPRLLWWLILNIFILPFRPARVARAYRHIWGAQNAEAPLRHITRQQADALQRVLNQQQDGTLYQVWPAMTYGQPALAEALQAAENAGVQRLVVLPMYPQYSSTTTAPVLDRVAAFYAQRRHVPTLQLIHDYHAQPGYIGALKASVQDFCRQHGASGRLLFSFHGIPCRYVDAGDPYAEQCHNSAKLLAEALALSSSEWSLAFQSRFGPEPWLTPYTDATLLQWAREGVESVMVICPAFAADCLETLEEIAIQNRDAFLAAGGKRFFYIPALNVSEAHIRFLAELVQGR